MIRFGLCCIFKKHPVKFRRTTAAFLLKCSRQKQLERLSDICKANAEALMQALIFCRDHQIGDFRINSQILPLKTHPDVGYDIADLPDAHEIIQTFIVCGLFSKEHDIRTTFHPDQFIILNSPRVDVIDRSIKDLLYQSQVSEWVNADVINIHAGGVYGDKRAALKRLRKSIDTLPDPVRSRLTLENDDRSYSPQDLWPVCQELEIPMVYDVHHHRCLEDTLTVEHATQLALETWNREPLFHISSPLHGFDRPDSRSHHDFINPDDLPELWRSHGLSENLTIEVEAKAKELAVIELMKALR